MRINLRFGMHRDIPLIHSQAARIDGLVIPAHILAHQCAPTSVFVASMADHGYIIDPMTFIFQHSRSTNSNAESGDLRLSVRKIAQRYHEDLFESLNSLDPDASLTPDDFPELRGFCERVLSFQTDAVATESMTSKAAKYISRYARHIPQEPRFPVAPYFRFESIRDPWYQFSLRCAQESHRIRGTRPLGVVIYCSVNMLDSQTIERIVADYSGLGEILVWLDNFDELGVALESICAARRLISAIHRHGGSIEALYGGYLLMLMQREGMSAVSHGILYTQHKSFDGVPGGGGAPDRFYIPRFHSFRSLSQTDLIFHQHPELICTCEVCREVMGQNPDRIILFSDEPELLREHFLCVRRQEADSIGEHSNLNELLSELRATHARYHSSIRRLPNPDAFVSNSHMRGLDFLISWADGISVTL